MQEANIYIDIDFSGKLSSGTGDYNIMLEYLKDGMPYTREYYHSFRETTRNRTAIKALITAMSYMKRPCKLEISINNPYVVQAVSQETYKFWLSTGVNAKGKRALNIDLWQQLSKQMEIHEVNLKYEQANSYSTYMCFAGLKATRKFEYDKVN